MPADDYICTICHQKVKTKLKRAHETGSKHRENLRRSNALKRPAESVEVEEETIASKKVRSDPDPVGFHGTATRSSEKPEDDEGQASALPDNFFDSAIKAKAAAASAELDREFSKFINEVDKIGKAEEEVDEKEDALRHDLDMIDEQIEMWRNLNELEKQKEQLVASAHARVLNDGTMHPDNEQDKDVDESDEEFDVFSLDWRSRKI